MADVESITKRVAIDRANLQVVIVTAIASFVTVFCLVASKSLISLNSYQATVISKKDTAKSELQTDIQSYNKLVSAYKSFVLTPTNVLGNPSTGSASNAADNSQIVLRALPPQYDFPAMITSIDKLLTNEGLDVTSISGTDEQLSERSNNSSASPSPVAMPFSFTVSNANYSSVIQLFNALQASIRPIQIQSITASGSSSNLTINVTAQTYYQPSKQLNITEQTIP
jgi:Tfp pilus assembly protein PilO